MMTACDGLQWRVHQVPRKTWNANFGEPKQVKNSINLNRIGYRLIQKVQLHEENKRLQLFPSALLFFSGTEIAMDGTDFSGAISSPRSRNQAVLCQVYHCKHFFMISFVILSFLVGFGWCLTLVRTEMTHTKLRIFGNRNHRHHHHFCCSTQMKLTPALTLTL